MLTPEQITFRLSGIGSSDVPAAADLLPATWKSRRGPEDVLREKCGLQAGFEGNGRTRRGDKLEPFIAQWWAEDQGRTVRRNPQTLRHPSIEWALATPDYLTDDEAEEPVECKLVSPWVAKSWNGEPPGYVYAQVTWQLAVLGKKRAHVAAFLEGGSDERLVTPYVVEFDEEFFADLVRAVTPVWNRIQAYRAELERKSA